MSSTEIQALAALDRPISSITGLQGELDNRAGQSATVAALSFKVDKEGSISLSESTANLLDRVKTPVPSGALFTDSVFNPATDVPSGSLEISQIGGLTAVLGSFKNASDSDIADTVLRNDITALETVVEALPPSQILVNGSFLDQARFSISNALPQLNVSAGLWEWLVQPRWSDLQRDPMRLRHARAGCLPLDPASDCLVYLPFAGSIMDLGPSIYKLCAQTSSAGTWGVYDYIPPKCDSCGWLAQTDGYIHPNRDLPITQVNSRGIGWGNATSDSWLVECQMWLPPDCIFYVVLSDDADAADSAPDTLNLMYASTRNGKMGFTWDDRSGVSGHYNQPTVSNAITANRWFHLAMQKNSGASTVRVYLDGVLRITENVAYPMTNIDVLRIDPHGAGVPFIREMSVRSQAVYPTVPFTPGPVSFASAIGDSQLRWNSYMLG
jgi:hypothetical protein